MLPPVPPDPLPDPLPEPLPEPLPLPEVLPPLPVLEPVLSDVVAFVVDCESVVVVVVSLTVLYEVELVEAEVPTKVHELLSL